MTPPVETPNLVDPLTAGDQRLLAEFKYAVDHWLPGMSAVAKADALKYAKAHAK